jgi:hypothetical protein
LKAFLPVSSWFNSQHVRPARQPVLSNRGTQWGYGAGVRRRGFGLLVLMIIAISLFAIHLNSVLAQSDEKLEPSREYAIKAAYLYNFTRYVEWPEETFSTKDAPFVIGLLGKDPFGEIVDEIARTKQVNQRRIVIKRFANMADYSPCHLLFVAASVNPQDKAAVIQNAHNAGVLVVSEDPDLARQGVIINFFIQDNTVRFEICPEVAKQERLKISAKLLSVAKIVQ